MKAKIKNVAQSKRNPSQKSRLKKQKTMPQQRRKSKISKLDKSKKQDEYLVLPEVPTETFDSVKAEVANLDTKVNSRDKGIENKLTKLEFFNPTWLKDVCKTKPISLDRKDHKVYNAAHDTVVENDDEVPAVGMNNEEPIAEHLESVQVVTEPVISSKEDSDAFNDWYLKKISESKIPKKSKSRFLS